MTRIIFTLLAALFLTAANVHAITLHVLWITAKNEIGINRDLRLGEAKNIPLALVADNFSGQIFDPYQGATWEPLGHTVREYTFGRGGDCPLEKNAILRFIANLSIHPNDAVMVYYRGHGGYDNKYRDDKYKQYLTQQHYDFRNDDGGMDLLPHWRIREEVEKLQPRLSVFVRDCCGSWITVPTDGVDPPMDSRMGSPGSFGGPRQFRQELFLSLFVRSSGVVDISSANVGLAAAAPPESAYSPLTTTKIFEPIVKCYQYGTILSNSFAEVFAKNRQKDLNWEAFCGQLKGDTEQLFKRVVQHYQEAKDVQTLEKLKECGTHTPRFAVIGGIYAVPNFHNRLAKSTIPPKHFGFEGIPVFGGVRLTRIDKGSRGEAYGFETDDIIHQVDGIMVTTYKELDLACRVLGDDGKLKFTVVDKNTGNTVDVDFPDIWKRFK